MSRKQKRYASYYFPDMDTGCEHDAILLRKILEENGISDHVDSVEEQQPMEDGRVLVAEPDILSHYVCICAFCNTDKTV